MRQLCLTAGEIAANEADQGQVHVRQHDRIVGLKPRRVNLVRVGCGRARGGHLEVGDGGIELAAQKRHHPESGLDPTSEPRPALLDAHAQDLEHLGRTAQVGMARVVARQGEQRRDQLVIPQIGPAQLQAQLEVGGRGAALMALCGRDEESALQPQGPLAAVAVRTRCAMVELREGLGQAGAGLGQRAAKPRIGRCPLVGGGRLVKPRSVLVVAGDQLPVGLTCAD